MQTEAKGRMPMWKAGTSSNKGFTFVEISVVLLVMAIFSAAAVPRMLAFLSGGESERSASRLGAYVEHIRDEAVFKRQILLLKCELERGVFTVVYPDGEAHRGVMMKPLSFPDEVKILDVVIAGRDKISEGEAFISFYPGGTAEEAFIHLKGENDTDITVDVAPLSRRVRIHEGYLEAT